MPEDNVWKVGIRGAPIVGRKSKYAELQQVTDKLSKSQVAGIIQWNDMVEVLQLYGLMEEKK